jgi:hypothetical protein
MKRLLSLALAVLLLPRVGAAPENPLLPKHVEDAEQRIKRYRSLPDNMSSRSLYSAAFVLAEANTAPDDIEFALATAARMQDRDTNSRGYGNLRWDWQDGSVLDYNAVEFVFRFNRRACSHRGKLFHRLMQQAASSPPVTGDDLAGQPADDAGDFDELSS